MLYKASFQVIRDATPHQFEKAREMNESSMKSIPANRTGVIICNAARLAGISVEENEIPACRVSPLAIQ